MLLKLFIAFVSLILCTCKLKYLSKTYCKQTVLTVPVLEITKPQNMQVYIVKDVKINYNIKSITITKKIKNASDTLKTVS